LQTLSFRLRRAGAEPPTPVRNFFHTSRIAGGKPRLRRIGELNALKIFTNASENFQDKKEMTEFGARSRGVRLPWLRRKAASRFE